MTTTRQLDLVDAIIADHRAAASVFAEIEASSEPRMRRDLVEHVIAELVRHSVGEEQYLYPVARKVLPDGDRIADHEIAEHTEAEKLMKELDRTAATEPRFDELAGKLIADIRHHIQDEENDLLPRLRQACDATELAELGEKFERAKKMAPTRPHPAAPDRPPANKILDPGAGLIDRLRDAITGRNT